MKYKVTLNGRTYEVEVEAGKAMLLDEYEAIAPAAPATAPAAAPAWLAARLEAEGLAPQGRRAEKRRPLADARRSAPDAQGTVFLGQGPRRQCVQQPL